MRHRKDRRRLNRNSSHRKATLKALMRAILWHGQIKTTISKAKELRREIEPLITLAAVDSVHTRRLAVARCGDKKILDKLFLQLGPQFVDRPGGYTRIVKAGYRKGDSAPMAYIQFVNFNDDESSYGAANKGSGATVTTAAKTSNMKAIDSDADIASDQPAEQSIKDVSSQTPEPTK